MKLEHHHCRPHHAPAAVPELIRSLDHFVRTLTFITFAFLAVTWVGCAGHTSNGRAMVAQIRNDHVRWDGNYFGLHVAGLGAPEQRVLAASSQCRPHLIEALGDESRFVAAHVLLTEMQHTTYPVSVTEWNHLRVELHADGSAEIPSGQRLEIQRLWTQK
jgi:hypothetical protein